MATTDYFLKMDGIKGEATDSKHKDELEILSYSFGGTQSASFATGGGGGAGKVQLHDIAFTKRVDKASTALFLQMCNGKHVKEATLTCRKAGGEQNAFLTITLSDVLIAGYQIAGHGSDPIPNENFTLAFAKIKIEYKEQKSDGTMGGASTVGWDVQANVKI